MKYIDPILFSQFTRNELPQSVMKEIEKELLESGTANAVFHSLIEDYHNTPDVDDLIGEDEEKNNIWQEREKQFDETCENLDNNGSVVVNQLNYTIMNNVNFTKEEMVNVTNRYNTIVENYKADVSLKENLVNAYMAGNPSKTKDEAEGVVSKLMAGCDTLTRKYNEALANGFDAENEISSICEGKSVKERYSFLVNALALVETLNLDNFASLADASDVLKKAIEDYNAATPEPTEEDCETMQKLLAEALVNNTLLVSSLEKARSILTTANEGTSSVVDFTSEQYDDAKQKAEMALAAWLEYEAGGIASVPQGASPEVIGVGAATAVEEAKIMADVVSSSKTTEIAIKCLKILGGVALTCIMGYYGILASAFAGGAIAYGLLSVLGTSTLACVATMVLVIPLLWGMAHLGVNAGTYILEKAGDAFDYVVEKLRESVFPKIAELTNKFITWFRSKFERRSGQVEVDPVVAPV